MKNKIIKPKPCEIKFIDGIFVELTRFEDYNLTVEEKKKYETENLKIELVAIFIKDGEQIAVSNIYNNNMDKLDEILKNQVELIKNYTV